jgi:energy-coupling factor transport system permease protein
MEQWTALGLLLAFVAGILVAARLRPTFKAILGLVLTTAVFASFTMLTTADPQATLDYTLSLILLMLTVPITALTIRPQDLARSLAKLGCPPALTVPTLLSWRFLPVLLSEAKAIEEARLLRGARASWRARFMPLIFVAVEYADRAGLALELRGFDPAAPRSVWRSPSAGRRDAVFLLLLAAVGVGAILLEVR